MSPLQKNVNRELTSDPISTKTYFKNPSGEGEVRGEKGQRVSMATVCLHLVQTVLCSCIVRLII